MNSVASNDNRSVCPNCNGAKLVPVTFTKDGKTETKSIECYACKGTGKRLVITK